MNNYGPRVLLTILAGGAFAMAWLWIITGNLPSSDVDITTMRWAMLGWSVASLYVLSYRFPILRRKLCLPLLLPTCVVLLIWGYFSVGNSLGREQAQWLSWNVYTPALLLAGPLAISSLQHRIWRSRWVRETLRFGDGDNARWSTRLEYHPYEIELPQRKNGKLGWLDCIYLGMTQFRHDVTPRHIGLKTDIHLYTLGMSGSGKSSTAAWINYALYGGASFIIDMKGEHSKKTGRRRSELGPVYNCDPFGITGKPSHRFNPLADVDVTTEEGIRLIAEIRNAFVLPETNTSTGSHFSDNAGTIFEGVTTWVCATFSLEKRNLMTVCRIINSQDPKSGSYDPDVFMNAIVEMSECPFGLCAQAAKLLDDAGDREGGSFLTTLNKSIKWMASEQMQKHLSGNDFSMKELATKGKKKPTIYVVIGIGNEHDYHRYIRLMTATAIFSIRSEYRRTGSRPTPSVLIGLDEYSLFAKDLECITTGFGTLRDAGCLLWVLAQKRSQIHEILGESASLLEQNSTVQILGVNNDDADVAAWVEDQLGHHEIKTMSGWGIFAKEIASKRVPLMTRRSVQDALSQLSPNQFIFPANGSPPMWLSRMAYKAFKINGKQVFKPLDLGDIFD